MAPPHSDDVAHMRAALALARRGLGNTWPNPSVGCIVVKDGRVLGRAVTTPGGRPHAETMALDRAGDAARGATAYVTLEPCCHWGRTPPCTDALIAAGIARVVIAVSDPDPRVDGRGIAQLRAADIEVVQGLLEAAAEDVIAGFALRVRQGRPLVTLKLASTLDGRIATASGESRWITGPSARRMAHALRGRHDAIMVGIGTVLADDPDLTCRLPGFRPTPLVRVVIDSRLRTPLAARLVATAAEAPTWVLTREGADPARRAALAARGVTVIEVAGAGPGVDLAAALAQLSLTGVARVLVE
ncbi:MAG: bifunctional diaminohydroxyphosphoribosylaminopyrimidine deaminase/5-amino-6-(5-phosphoribosylamino)uracil reductase RibD, partial [Pseudomonadota bacterium]|nr:bifunctional diaminohydroxyphosphoribosylaminopyrimidine deaminase/5-amino-6-(5-phosphoribosylamino)uracil reductase RibD [Pseudomonadota bacterium]